jgi:hypothetical protein
MFILKKIPTFLLYNSKFCILVVTLFFKMLSSINNRWSLINFAKYYRKTNPGFSHNNYLLNPSHGLMKSIKDNLDYRNYKKIEHNYITKHQYFINKLEIKHQHYFFPWYKKNNLITPYNTIYIDKTLINEFELFCNTHNILLLPNPTWKTFNIDLDINPKYQLNIDFNNNLYYLNSLANMNIKEISFLANKLIEFYHTRFKSCIKCNDIVES